MNEKKLLVAIIFRGVLDLLSCEKHLQKEARIFFEWPSHEKWSFRWICEHLDICPDRCLRILKSRGYFDPPEVYDYERAKRLRKYFKAFLRWE